MSGLVLASKLVDETARTLGQALPRIGGALLLLLVGVPLAALAARAVRRLLHRVGIDSLGERVGIHDALERVGLRRSIGDLLGRAVRIALIVVVVVAALSLLGLGALSATLNAAVLFVPRLFVALAIVLIGVVAAEFVGDRAEGLADQMALGVPVGQVARAAVITLAVLMGLAQLGIPTLILMAVIGVLFASVALTLALSFGLGGRGVARELSAGRYVSGAFTLGQRITVSDFNGEIVGFDNAATTIRTDDGGTTRLPNHLLVESIVTVHGSETAPASES